MFKYRYVKSKQGFRYPLIYWEFPSGKLFHISMPYNVAQCIAHSGYAEELHEI